MSDIAQSGKRADSLTMRGHTEIETMESRAAAFAEAENLIDRLHAEAEAHKATLARAIHDDLGGLMVSAAMDFTALQQRATHFDQAAIEKLERGRKTLEAAIVLSRKMVEELRPSILDNFGLFAALKWQLKKASIGSSATLTESYPSTEPAFQPAALTALFRVAEEAIGMIFNRGSVSTAAIDLHMDNDVITMRFTDDGIPLLSNGLEVGAASALTSMQHRIGALGGTVAIVQEEAGGTVLTARLPIPQALSL